MNILRKFVWLLLTLGLLVLTVQTASPIAFGLAICMVVLPLLCLPFNLLAAKKLKLSANMPVNLKKGTEGLLEVTVQNPSFFPICLCACRIRLENQLNGETQHMTLSCGVWPKKTQTVRVAAKHEGRRHLLRRPSCIYAANQMRNCSARTVPQQRSETGRSPIPSHALTMPTSIARPPIMGESVAVRMAGKVMTASVT